MTPYSKMCSWTIPQFNGFEKFATKDEKEFLGDQGQEMQKMLQYWLFCMLGKGSNRKI